jgi:hypothetical protein
MAHYVIGVNDTKNHIMVKAEILKYIMHFRHLEPEDVMHRAITYLKAVNRHNQVIMAL